MTSMRHILTFCLLTVTALVGARKITKVECLFGHTNRVEVSCIEYTPEATILTFKTTKECVPTLKVGHGIFIVDDKGKRHHAIGTDGIKLDSLYVMVKGQTRKFSIAFDPVAMDNNFLDIKDSDHMTMYGLHDKNLKFTIPKVEQDIDSNEYKALSSGEEGYVEIEGTYHSNEEVEGTVLYIDYDNLTANSFQLADKYAKVDKNGHFKFCFRMDSPKSVAIQKGRMNYGECLGLLYLRPGDKLQLEVSDPSSGIGLSSQNLTGRRTYDKYSNIMERRQFFFFNISDYIRNWDTDLNYMGYDAHYADLWDCYKKDSVYINYICWHNQCSPYENHLIITTMKEMYVWHFLVLDRMVNTLYDKLKSRERDAIHRGTETEFDGSDSIRLLQYMKKMDYSYFRLLNPDDLTSITIDYFPGITSMINVLTPLSHCHDAVDMDDKNRWIKIIELQQKELNRIAGWTGIPLVMQMSICMDYSKVFDLKPADEKQYQQVRALLANPYCKQFLDRRHQELKDWASHK